MAECNCGQTFRTAEDYRDHLPCSEPTSTPVFEVTTVYQYGHSDGYTHQYDHPFYPTYAQAEAAGSARHGAYAVTPRPRDAIVLADGTCYLVEGPYKMASAVEAERALRRSALKKLTKAECAALGIKEGDRDE